MMACDRLHLDKEVVVSTTWPSSEAMVCKTIHEGATPSVVLAPRPDLRGIQTHQTPDLKNVGSNPTTRSKRV